MVVQGKRDIILREWKFIWLNGTWKLTRNWSTSSHCCWRNELCGKIVSIRSRLQHRHNCWECIILNIDGWCSLVIPHLAHTPSSQDCLIKGVFELPLALNKANKRLYAKHCWSCVIKPHLKRISMPVLWVKWVNELWVNYGSMSQWVSAYNRWIVYFKISLPCHKTLTDKLFISDIISSFLKKRWIRSFYTKIEQNFKSFLTYDSWLITHCLDSLDLFKH